MSFVNGFGADTGGGFNPTAAQMDAGIKAGAVVLDFFTGIVTALNPGQKPTPQQQALPQAPLFPPPPPPPPPAPLVSRNVLIAGGAATALIVTLLILKKK